MKGRLTVESRDGFRRAGCKQKSRPTNRMPRSDHPTCPKAAEGENLNEHDYRRRMPRTPAITIRMPHAHAPYGQLPQQLRLLQRPQGHRHPVPVLHAVWFLVGGLLALARALASGLALVADAGARQSAVLGRRGPDLARVLHHAVHHARHGDDLLRDHSDSGRCVRQLSDPADDRRRRHGLSHAEHAQLLVHVAGVSLLSAPASSSPAGPPRRAGPAIRRSRQSGRRPAATWGKRCG